MEQAYAAALAKAQIAKEALDRRRMSSLASSNYRDNDYQQARSVPTITTGKTMVRPSLPSEARQQMHADLKKLEKAKVNLFVCFCIGWLN